MSDTRAHVSDDLCRFLGQRYAVRIGEIRDLGGGLNLNLLFHNGSERLVARVYRQHVHADRLAAVQEARRLVGCSGVPCADLVPALNGAPAVEFGGRLVEVERFVEHDGLMNTPGRLRRGLSWLGQIHSALRQLPPSDGVRDAGAVNDIEPARVLEGTARGTARIRGWRPTPDELVLADRSDQLAEAVAIGEAAIVPSLSRQAVHGDFWDNNVFFQGEEPVMVADFDFMGERPRIDDLALTLYFADGKFDLDAADERIAALRPLVDAYAGALDQPLADVERMALPWAFARQPLWGIGGWVPRLPDGDEARSHANETASGVERALQVVQDVGRWTDGLA